MFLVNKMHCVFLGFSFTRLTTLNLFYRELFLEASLWTLVAATVAEVIFQLCFLSNREWGVVLYMSEM